LARAQRHASNRGNATGNNQPAQQKDERADKRSGSEDATRGDRLEKTYRVVLRGVAMRRRTTDGLKTDTTIKFRTTRRTWRDTAARDNQIEDDVKDVERYCGNCAV
jgi:hypothetical protein